MSGFIDLTGKKFGKLTAIQRCQKPENAITEDIYWMCDCECGGATIVCGKCLRSGSTKTCGCSGKAKNNQHMPKNIHDKRKNPESLLNYIYNLYKASAKNRKLSFNIGKNIFKEIINQECYYCGSPPSNIVKRQYSGEMIYNGIDRVDNNVGYEVNNLVPCCKICNFMKKDMEQQKFILWINKTYEHIHRNTLL